MSKITVFDFSEYKGYLKSHLGGKSHRRGVKSALAHAIPCQPTYVSQVLNGEVHFSLEQATSINRFFGHTEEESHFFLLLLMKDRAGNAELKTYFGRQIENVLEQRLNLTSRLGTKNDLDENEKSIFYSSWHYAAIHMALTVPALRTKEALAHHFRLPLAKITRTLDFLISVGLAN
jgi:hypothetical protein